MQPSSQPAHSLWALLPVQAGTRAAAARSEQQGPPLTEIAQKAQIALQASMQQPAVSEACPAQPSQQQHNRVQAPTPQQTGQPFARDRSSHAPQHEHDAQEMRQEVQIPPASGREAGSAAPGLGRHQEQQRPHAQANVHVEGITGARQGSWSSSEGDDDFADWEQHILASAAPEPAGADAEQQDAGTSGLPAALSLPEFTAEAVSGIAAGDVHLSS